jgi:predicted extracellular nuclease
MHIRTPVLFLAGILVLMSCFVYPADASANNDSVRIRIMFYNTENFFDNYDDPSTDDNEFLPSGLMRWSFQRYTKKINSLYKTIVAAGEWDPPAIVAMCEVENRKVLEDLVDNTNLKNFGYGIVHEDSPDTRGIDVCLIFRKDIVRIAGYRYYTPSVTGEFQSRNILYAKCIVLDDTLHILVNHWPSRRGGVLAGDEMRTGISAKVASVVDSICASSVVKQKIIITGDFNSHPDDQVVKSLTNAGHDREMNMINVTRRSRSAVQGTYRYQGTWELFDQFIISSGLSDSLKGLFAGDYPFRIFDAEFLLSRDPKYPGPVPFATYRGYRYQGGFSDHLPILLDLGYR